jgi:glycerophosphoryl diester phosphodiesterase
MIQAARGIADARSGKPDYGEAWLYRSAAYCKTGDRNRLSAEGLNWPCDRIFSDWPATVTYYANCMGLD